MTLQERCRELVKTYGSQRAAARVINVDNGYFCRMLYGRKKNPSGLILRRMGLKKVVTYERID